MAEPPKMSEAQFLNAIWDRLENAFEVSTSRQVMSRLEDLQRHCEEIVDLIRAQR